MVIKSLTNQYDVIQKSGELKTTRQTHLYGTELNARRNRKAR